MNLDTPIGEVPSIGPIYESRLEKLGILTVRDLIMHTPARYEDFSQVSKIANASVGENITIQGTIEDIENIYTRRGTKYQLARVADGSGEIHIVWFNQPYLAKSLIQGTRISLAGQVGWFSRKKAIFSPLFEIIPKNGETLHTARIIPIYPETKGVSSKWLRRKIFDTMKQVEKLEETLPTNFLKNYNLVEISTALNWAHFPQNLEQAEKGRYRLAFEEMLDIHLTSIIRKRNWQLENHAIKVNPNRQMLERLIASLPYELRKTQEKALKEILDDMKRETPMNRLLQGDVGSGKTIVAALTAYACYTNNYKTVFMAPTQILATQHYKNLLKIYNRDEVRLSLITTNTKKLEEADIYIGTHALIHKKINLDNTALVVIDEQHRFGVEQRKHLVKRTNNRGLLPHILTMTATPIPRTITLTLYGDLDLSVLTFPNQNNKVTWIVPKQKREKAYEWIQDHLLKNHSQGFVVCPLVEESDKETMKSAKAAVQEYKQLSQKLPKIKVGLLHGKMKTDEKDKVIDQFKSGKIKLLVATPVIEVGIDMPNANIIVIETAERFGLSQLHQLRGRIGRLGQKSYCLLFSDSKEKNNVYRLEAMRQNLSGFELAELDLKLRGPGEVSGTKQHGLWNLKYASWSDTKLLETTKEAATKLSQDPKKARSIAKKIKMADKILN